IGVCAGFDGPPIVACGYDDGVDAVHDAFVVRSGAVRVNRCEFVGVDNAVNDVNPTVFAGLQQFGRQPQMRARQSQVGKIGQNAQSDAAAGNLLHASGHGFGHGVDGVGAHGVADIDNQVDDDHGAAC